MKEEIHVGVEFLRQFLSKYGNQLTQEIIDKFASRLTTILHERYINHWYINIPLKGQAFRCLRLRRSENYIDPVLEQILKELCLTLNQLGLPNDFTLWIDPGEVSVRFGDQVGYTYAIAKLEHTRVINSDSMLEKGNVKQYESKIDYFEKPTLVVQNAEQILFDEKLTAFIRQNSSNNEDSNTKESYTFELPTNNENSNIEEFIKLSAEKRTISPPCSFSPNFKNFPNIKIECNKPSEKLSSSVINKSQLFSNNADNIQSNRFSFNESCLYSSSSSSCASSFGSNTDENNFLYGWLYNENNNRNTKPNKSFFNVINENYKTNDFNNQSHLSDTSNQMSFKQSNYFFATPLKNRQQSFGFINDTNFSSQNSDVLNSISNININQSNNIYSDASSERSDTPSSCITNASSVNSNFINFPNLNNFPFSYEKNAFESTTMENSVPDSLSSSSDASTTTTMPIDIDTIQSGGFNEFDMGKINSEETNTNEKKENLHALEEKNIDEKSCNNRSRLVSDESSLQTGLVVEEPKQNKNDTKKAKEDTYCGYVESFPYYYKLNRLYNALAVQKLQTDRLRKNNNSSPFNNVQQNINSNAQSSLTSHARSNSLGISPTLSNQNGLVQWDSKTNNFPTNQHSFQMPYASSPSSKSSFSSNQQSSVLFSTSSPPNHQPFSNSFQNQHMNSQNQFAEDKSQQSKNLVSFSPKNIPTSYINQNQRQNRNSNNNRYQTSKPKQTQNQYNFQTQHKSQMPNNMFPNKSHNSKANNKNSILTEQPNFVFGDQNEFEKQQQLMNSIFNQMNSRQNTDDKIQM